MTFNKIQRTSGVRESQEEHIINASQLSSDKQNVPLLILKSKADLALAILQYEDPLKFNKKLTDDHLRTIIKIFTTSHPSLEEIKQIFIDAQQNIPGSVACQLKDRCIKLMGGS